MSDKVDIYFKIMDDSDLLKDLQSTNLIAATCQSYCHADFNNRHPKPWGNYTGVFACLFLK